LVVALSDLLQNLYASSNIIVVIKSGRIRLTGHVAWVAETKYIYNILVGKPGRKTSHGRPRHRWEDNIRIDLKEIAWEDVDWMHLS
jgi:hypothetical protein